MSKPFVFLLCLAPPATGFLTSRVTVLECHIHHSWPFSFSFSVCAILLVTQMNDTLILVSHQSNWTCAVSVWGHSVSWVCFIWHVISHFREAATEQELGTKSKIADCHRAPCRAHSHYFYCCSPITHQRLTGCKHPGLISDASSPSCSLPPADHTRHLLCPHVWQLDAPHVLLCLLTCLHLGESSPSLRWWT